MRWYRSLKPAKEATSIIPVAAGCHPACATDNAQEYTRVSWAFPSPRYEALGANGANEPVLQPQCLTVKLARFINAYEFGAFISSDGIKMGAPSYCVVAFPGGEPVSTSPGNALAGGTKNQTFKSVFGFRARANAKPWAGLA